MKNVIILILIFTSISIYSQSDKSQLISLEKQVLKKAKNIGDPSVSSASMYRLIVLEGKNSTYKDSLAYIYFSGRKYAPCFMITTEVLLRDPKHIEMLEMKAISLEALGALEKSEEVYKQLFPLTNNNFHGYTLAKLQYSLKKYDEAYTTIKKTEKINDTGKYKVTYSINQNHTQQIELLAAIAYLKGLIEVELNQKSAAKISFEKAIKIQSDFVFAKESLEELK